MSPNSKNSKRRAPKKTAKRSKARSKKQLSPWWILGALLAVVAVALLLPRRGLVHNPLRGAAVPEGYHQYMLDLSHHNPKAVQWDSLRLAIDRNRHTSKDYTDARDVLPLQYVVLKATEGESLKDKHFSSWWQEAGEAGFSRGAYHFFRSGRDPQLQAQNYIERVKLTHKDLPPVLDVETVHSGCTREQLNNKLRVWLEMVGEYYGRRPIIYTSDAFARDWLLPAIKDNYTLWLARYNSQPPTTPGWRYWQFTDKAVVYGVEGYVDLSVIK